MAVYESSDKMDFRRADDANVPVDIWLLPPDEDCARWTLKAANYMPRKGHLHPDGYEQTADTREELAALVAAHVLPLYRIAVAQIEAIAAGDADHLYYWQEAR